MEIIVVAAMLALVVLLGIAVKGYDLKRKREEGLPLTPTAQVPLWSGTPLTLEIRRAVPRSELREAAVDVAALGHAA